jgi:PII-like signaling protein
MTQENNNQRIAALRLYFPAATRTRVTRLWHRLSAPALAHHLIAVARRANILQAMLHHIICGYLPGERLSHHHPEISGMRHPQCLELVDTEARLRQFMHDHADELRKVHVVLLFGELPLTHRRGANAYPPSSVE